MFMINNVVSCYLLLSFVKPRFSDALGTIMQVKLSSLAPLLQPFSLIYMFLNHQSFFLSDVFHFTGLDTAIKKISGM